MAPRSRRLDSQRSRPESAPHSPRELRQGIPPRRVSRFQGAQGNAGVRSVFWCQVGSRLGAQRFAIRRATEVERDQHGRTSRPTVDAPPNGLPCAGRPHRVARQGESRSAGVRSVFWCQVGSRLGAQRFAIRRATEVERDQQGRKSRPTVDAPPNGLPCAGRPHRVARQGESMRGVEIADPVGWSLRRKTRARHGEKRRVLAGGAARRFSRALMSSCSVRS